MHDSNIGYSWRGTGGELGGGGSDVHFKAVCFGLKNVAGNFERLMEIVLKQLKSGNCIVCLYHKRCIDASHK